MANVELFGTARCEFTREMRDWLDWRGVDFVEYDVERDCEARARMAAVAGDARMVPFLVEDGKIVQVGWRGRGCLVD
ncbi:MAG TPA: glutaredoxin [Vicinamibacterales bacterium]|jgi:glutaredoxin|nr:glutaredoxin [Vicinamibacterales bacterium]